MSTAAPAAAGNGDPLLIGQANTGTAPTTMSGSTLEVLEHRERRRGIDRVEHRQLRLRGARQDRDQRCGRTGPSRHRLGKRGCVRAGHQHRHDGARGLPLRLGHRGDRGIVERAGTPHRDGELWLVAAGNRHLDRRRSDPRRVPDTSSIAFRRASARTRSGCDCRPRSWACPHQSGSTTRVLVNCRAPARSPHWPPRLLDSSTCTPTAQAFHSTFARRS